MKNKCWVNQMNEFSASYGSGVSVWDSKNLSTLSIFYDRVYLPASDSHSADILVEFSRRKGSQGRYRLTELEVEGFEISPIWDDKTLIPIEDYVSNWEKFYQPLFQEGVLHRFPRWQREDEFELNEDVVEEISDLLIDTPSALRVEM